MSIRDLAKEFDRGAVHWRAQTLTRNGDKALALAYLDARDVQDRLDEVCGPENWQTEYNETAKGRIICRIGIRVEGDWVWKSDGAGDTAVEGEKGGISDAFKRAAVHWGIGRYLYRLDAVWCPCATYEKNGKKHWQKWTDDPWNHVRNAPRQKPQEQRPDPQAIAKWLSDAIAATKTKDELDAFIADDNAKHNKAWKWLCENAEPEAKAVDEVLQMKRAAFENFNAQD